MTRKWIDCRDFPDDTGVRHDHKNPPGIPVRDHETVHLPVRNPPAEL